MELLSEHFRERHLTGSYDRVMRYHIDGAKRWQAMELLNEEKIWLDSFIRTVRWRFPEKIKRVIVYGSKVRGHARPDSDLDILVVLRDNTVSKAGIRLIGYELALEADVLPSILVYTVQELEQRRKHRSVFIEAVEREGVVVT